MEHKSLLPFIVGRLGWELRTRLSAKRELRQESAPGSAAQLVRAQWLVFGGGAAGRGSCRAGWSVGTCVELSRPLCSFSLSHSHLPSPSSSPSPAWPPWQFDESLALAHRQDGHTRGCWHLEPYSCSELLGGQPARPQMGTDRELRCSGLWARRRTCLTTECLVCMARLGVSCTNTGQEPSSYDSQLPPRANECVPGLGRLGLQAAPKGSNACTSWT